MYVCDFILILSFELNNVIYHFYAWKLSLDCQFEWWTNGSCDTYTHTHVDFWYAWHSKATGEKNWNFQTKIQGQTFDFFLLSANESRMTSHTHNRINTTTNIGWLFIKWQFWRVMNWFETRIKKKKKKILQTKFLLFL